MKTLELLESYKKPFNGTTEKGYHAYVKRILEYYYQTPIKAIYDDGMNCLYCGESGKCPGYHTQDDLNKGA